MILHCPVTGGGTERTVTRVGPGKASMPAMRLATWPPRNKPPSTFGSVEADLFHMVVTQELPPGPGPDPEPSRPASKRIIAGYGFWAFLPSDIIMFAAFASSVVLVGETAGGPAGRDLVDLRSTGVETGCLLLSSFTCDLASVGLQARNGRWFCGAMAVTFVLGAAFIGLELREFWSMIANGNGPGRSALLSPSSRSSACTACTSLLACCGWSPVRPGVARPFVRAFPHGSGRCGA